MIAQLLDLIIGLAFVYFLFSTLASAMVELLEIRFRRRALYLEQGVRELLGSVYRAGDRKEGQLRVLAQAFYQSPHISSLFRGEYPAQPVPAAKGRARLWQALLRWIGRSDRQRERGLLKQLPSYIPAERFVNALNHLAETAEGEADKALQTQFAKLRSQICAVMGLPADASAQQQIDAIGRYYQESMDRVSGWYRRWVGVWLLLVGLGVAGAFNVDTLELVRTLSQNPQLREQLVSQAVGLEEGSGLRKNSVQSCREGDKSLEQQEECVSQARQQVQGELDLLQGVGLPISWTTERWQALQRRGTTNPPAPNCAQGHRGLDLLCKLTKLPAHHWELLDPWAFTEKLLGLLLTAIAISLGAPFWFDLISQLSAVRASLKPKEEKKPAAAH